LYERSTAAPRGWRADWPTTLRPHRGVRITARLETLLASGLRLFARLVRLNGNGGLPANQILPGQLLSLAPPFLGELQALGRDRQHVGLAADVDFALQNLVELCCHHTLSPQ